LSNFDVRSDYGESEFLWNCRKQRLTGISFVEKILNNPVVGESLSQAPKAYLIKIFLEWLASTRIGILEENITNTTIGNRLARLKRVVKMYTNYQYSSVQNKEVDDFMVQLVCDQKVSTAAYAKPVAPVEISQDLVHSMWACDEYQQPHLRAYPQLAFLIDIYTEMGTRPGEVIKSDARY
jgi:hypothetical protein